MINSNFYIKNTHNVNWNSFNYFHFFYLIKKACKCKKSLQMQAFYQNFKYNYRTGIPLDTVIGATPYTSVVKLTKFGWATTPFHSSESRYVSTDSALEK